MISGAVDSTTDMNTFCQQPLFYLNLNIMVIFYSIYKVYEKVYIYKNAKNSN
jgi:hypothetical protein